MNNNQSNEQQNNANNQGNTFSSINNQFNELNQNLNNNNQSNQFNNNNQVNQFNNNNEQQNINNYDQYLNNNNQSNQLNNNNQVNQFNNNNEQQNTNNYGSNLNNQNNNNINQTSDLKTKLKNKNIIIIVLIIVTVVAALLIFKSCGSSSVLGNHKNNTGSPDYNASDVNFNCTYEESKNDRNLVIYSDYLFNYKSEYQLKVYYKMIVEKTSNFTDDEYQEIVKSFNSPECLFSNKCTGDHLEIGMTEMGYDTVINRSGNKIEATYYNVYGAGQTATSKEIKEMKKSLEEQGSKCN